MTSLYTQAVLQNFNPQFLFLKPKEKFDPHDPVPRSVYPEIMLLGSIIAFFNSEAPNTERGFGGLAFEIKDEYFATEEGKWFWNVLCEMKDAGIDINGDGFHQYCFRKAAESNVDCKYLGWCIACLWEHGNTQNINAYAKWMVEDFCKREIKRLSAIESEDVTERILNLRDSLDELSKTEGLGNAKFALVNDILETFTEELSTAINASREEKDRLVTGYENHDKSLSFSPGHLIVLGGRSGMGKTSYATNLLRKMVMAGKRVAMFSLEMTREEIMGLLVAQQGEIDNSKLTRPEDFTDRDIDALYGGMQQFYNTSLAIVDEARATSGAIARQCLQIRRKFGGLDAIFIDHMHIMGDDKKFGSVREKMMYISAELKNIAKDLKVPIFALAQCNRECDKRVDKRPLVVDLKESGSIEQDADTILMVYRPNYYDENKDDDKTYIIVRKNRHGTRSNFHIAMEVNPKTKKYIEHSERN